MLKKIDIFDFVLDKGICINHIPLFYQVFGQPIGTAPVVVVNHALTGNSNVIGNNGWWNHLIGTNSTIDTDVYTIVAFNIPGNGFDGNKDNLINNYKDYTAKDMAKLFWKGLFHLQIDNVFAVIGGSLGGGIAWEMAVEQPTKIKNLIPIATDWKATDWVIANVLLQDKILNNSSDPLADARIHAMMLYRTPQSFKQKFNRTINENQPNYHVENWLINHGEKLKNRFTLEAYKLMNHLLQTIDITKKTGSFLEAIKQIEASIHVVAINSDLFFIANENHDDVKNARTVKPSVFYHEIQSIHGHDAFLIEFNQLNEILNPIFNNADTVQLKKIKSAQN
ncbi:MAG TPA: homoserine acetyltransferase [Flavobacterium sp.]|nr:homoserine acetyltransferase [Flavobacterium sp.]